MNLQVLSELGLMLHKESLSHYAKSRQSGL
jgi:hypothetical protein